MKFTLQPYPRKKGQYLADDSIFPASPAISDSKLNRAVKAAFDRVLTKKKGGKNSPEIPPGKLVDICIKHLKERSDPILSPSFLSLLDLRDVFIMDAVSHEMQRHRMKIGEFYQYLVIELMKVNFTSVYDGKKEGDVEAEIDTPGFAPGLRLYISVKKSKDTVGGQDIGGVFRRLESLGREDKNLSRPYMGVFAIATPPKGACYSYQESRSIRCKQDGTPYSPNIEEWLPGFLYPYVCGRSPHEVYKASMAFAGTYLPFNSLKHKEECSLILEKQLRSLHLVNDKTGKIDPVKFQKFLIEGDA